MIEKKCNLSRIRDLLNASGMTVHQFCDDAGIGVATYEQTMSGRYSPSIDFIWNVADYFAVPIDYLIGRTDMDFSGAQYSKIFEEFRKNAYEKSMFSRRPAGFPHIPDGHEAPWPYNLINDIFEEEVRWIATDDQLDGLNYVIRLLSKKEAETIYDIYKESKTLNEIAGKFKVTKERVRQIYAKALRKLRSYHFKKFVEDGFRGYDKLQEENRYISMRMKEIQKRRLELAEAEAKKDIPIEDKEMWFNEPLVNVVFPQFDLSVRSTNCLLRAGLDTISKIVRAMNDETILHVRNLGRKSLLEIQCWLKDVGCKYDVETGQWSCGDEFI